MSANRTTVIIAVIFIVIIVWVFLLTVRQEPPQPITAAQPQQEPLIEAGRYELPPAAGSAVSAVTEAPVPANAATETKTATVKTRKSAVKETATPPEGPDTEGSPEKKGILPSPEQMQDMQRRGIILY